MIKNSVQCKERFDKIIIQFQTDLENSSFSKLECYIVSSEKLSNKTVENEDDEVHQIKKGKTW